MGDYHPPARGTMEIIPPEDPIIPPEACIIPPEGRRRPKAVALLNQRQIISVILSTAVVLNAQIF